tara:strand:+ start:7076 stop:7366 length:291 start_codon:yes stop_codon:yes gene_type:complete
VDQDQNLEAQLVATQNFLKILPYFLGVGWIVLVPVIYVFVTPIFSDDIFIKVGVTICFATFSLIVDVIFFKIMTRNVEIMAQKVEEESLEPFTKRK